MSPHTVCKRCGEKIESDGGSLTYGYITLSAKKVHLGWSIQSAELCESCQISFNHWLHQTDAEFDNYISEGVMKHG